MTKLIVNADDFGYSQGVNYGIIESFKAGIVTSATLMVNMPGRDHAVQLAKQHPELGVGIHLVLTRGIPISQHVPSLVNGRGEFHPLGEWIQYAQQDEIERELNSQFETFLSLGLTPTHIDSHHHVHAHESVVPIVKQLAKKYDLPVRNMSTMAGQPPDEEIKAVDIFLHGFYGKGVTKDNIIRMLDEALVYRAVEIMCHPAFVDVDLLNGSVYNLQRVHELEILTDPEVRSAVKARQFDLVSYREWND